MTPIAKRYMVSEKVYYFIPQWYFWGQAQYVEVIREDCTEVGTTKRYHDTNSEEMWSEAVKIADRDAKWQSYIEKNGYYPDEEA